MKNNFASNIVQIIFTLVGAGMLIAGYMAAPGSQTDDGYPLNYFFYSMGAFFIIWPLILFFAIRFFTGKSVQKEANLRANGIKGKARVTQMRRTGVTINNVPQVILELNITTDLGEKMQASYKKCIDPIYYNIIRPDADFTVYIDPANFKSVYIDFDEEWARLASKPAVQS
jgi:hypothetical protein